MHRKKIRSDYLMINANVINKTVDFSDLIIEPFDPESQHNELVYSLNPDSNTDLSQDRHSLIKKQLRTDHLNDEENCAITELCLKFSYIFYLDGDLLAK